MTTPEYSSISSISSNSSIIESDFDMMFGVFGSKGSYVNSHEFLMFNIVGYNFDKFVKPIDMRLDPQASMLYCFNMHAVCYRLKKNKLSEYFCDPF